MVKDLFQEYFFRAEMIDGSIGVAKQAFRKAKELQIPQNGYSLEFIDTLDSVNKKKNFDAYFTY